MNGVSVGFMQGVLVDFVQEQGTQNAAAARLGISPQYLNDLLLGRREISNAIAQKLGYRRQVTYAPLHDTAWLEEVSAP